MNDEEKVQATQEVKSIVAKLDILRNFMIVADEGHRQQQTAQNDEIVMVMRDINSQLTRLLRAIEK